ncbi:hypothetical protein M5K25_011951 [Dendrobium thyrsiflorum]|uniref:Uncharacterized protein n=1 Tax=Dendrobium thyrsiflorum TaxID=117978 RepID=A0ABD0V4H8_DENTH
MADSFERENIGMASLDCSRRKARFQSDLQIQFGDDTPKLQCFVVKLLSKYNKRLNDKNMNKKGLKNNEDPLLCEDMT